MKILISGGTGVIGRALCLRLLRDGHRVSVVTRQAPGEARKRVGAEVDLVDAADEAAVGRAVSSSDGVVNLAGEDVAARRWSEARREALRDSRIGLTNRLVQQMAGGQPRVFVSASAIGFYGDRGDDELTEQSGPGEGFLAELCQEWEEAARVAEARGCRVVRLRIGVVLADGGALARLRPIFRLGLGGPIGSGRQHVSWIHITDMVEMLVQALTNERYSGAINAVAPQPVTFKQLARAIGRALRRPAFIPLPALLLVLFFGEMASALLSSQRVSCARARQLGFRFAFADIGAALDDLLVPDPTVKISRAHDPPQTAYLVSHKPLNVLEQRTRLQVPAGELFSFFSRAENLGVMTPGGISFSFTEPPPERVEAGAEMAYKIRLAPLIQVGWRTQIEVWEPARRFVDNQQKGPYACWWHEHRFEARGAETVMVDRVYYAVSYSSFGRLVHWLWVAPSLRRIFAHRRRAVSWRFGPGRAQD